MRLILDDLLIADSQGQPYAWRLFFDCVLDTVAVAFACYAPACVGHGMKIPAIMCWGASVGVILAGWRARQ